MHTVCYIHTTTQRRERERENLRGNHLGFCALRGASGRLGPQAEASPSTSISVSLHIYIYIYIYIYICIYVYTYPCLYICLSLDIYGSAAASAADPSAGRSHQKPIEIPPRHHHSAIQKENCFKAFAPDRSCSS